MKDKTAAVLLPVVFVAGIFVCYAVMQTGVIQPLQEQLQQAQMQAQQAPRYIEPSDIRMEVSPTTLNYSAAVNSSDDVATQTWKNATITLEVKDIPGVREKTTVRLTLQAPGEENGLPDELEQNEFQVYVHTTSGDTWLFGSDDWDGKYHSGYTFDISENQKMTITLATTMKACEDVFEDGKSHTITVYLWEPNVGLNGAGKVIDEITLTLET